MRKKPLFTAVCIVAVLGTSLLRAASGKKNMTFHASFDKDFSPDLAAAEKSYSLHGTPVTTDGVSGKAIIISGKDSIEFPRKDNLPLDKGSLSLWVKPIDWSPRIRFPQIFFSLGGTTSSDWILLYKFWSKPTLLYLTGKREGGETYSIKSSICSWKKSRWQHLAATWDYTDPTKGVIKLYVNGKLSKKLENAKKPSDLGKSFFLGGNILQSPSTGGKSAIDEVKIFNFPLAEKEVALLFSRNKPKDEAIKENHKEGKTLFSKKFPIEKTGDYRFIVQMDKSTLPQIEYNISIYDINGKKLSNPKGKLSVLSGNDKKTEIAVNFTTPEMAAECELELSLSAQQENYKIENFDLQELKASYPSLHPINLKSEWDAEWISNEKKSAKGKLYFQKTFPIQGEIKEAKIQVTSNCNYKIYINDYCIPVSYGKKNIEETSETYEISEKIRKGKNVIQIILPPSSFRRFAIAQANIELKDKKTLTIGTDKTWTSATDADKNTMPTWLPAKTFPKRKFKGTSFISSFVPVPKAKEAIKTTKVEMNGENAAVFLNGKLYELTHFHLLHFNAEEIARIRDSGIHTYILAFFPENGMLGWFGPEKYNHSIAEQFIKALIKIDPNAKIIPAVWLSALNIKWWPDLNPNELCRDNKNNYFLANRLHGKIRVESLGSERWLRESGNAFKSFVKKLESGPLSEYIIGYYITMFFTRECQYWGMGERQYAVDFSKPMLEEFKKWVAQNSGDKNSSLNKLANVIDKNKIRIPSLGERSRFGYGSVCNPAQDWLSILYYDFLSQRMAYFLNYYGKIAKESTNKKKIIGTLYGYAISLDHGSLWQRERGHLSLKNILNAPYIDLIGSPTGYDNRGMGESGSFTSVPASVNLHRKLFVNQEDLRTYVQKIQNKRNEDLNDLSAGNLKESASIIKREFAMALASNTPIQWYEFCNHWLTLDLRIMEVLKICKKISNFYISFKDTVKPENSIAWIINERSGLYGLEKKIRSPYENLFRIGIPIKAYLLSDLLKHPQLQKHKVFIFANCSYMTDEELEFIRDNLQKNGNTLIWSGIPPLFNGSKVLFERASKAVGFDLETSLDERFIDTISSGDLNFEPTNIKQSPVFWVKDKNIIPVAKLIGSDDVGIAIKKFPEWTSVYSALNELPPEFIRQLINGKLHVYSDSNDPVYISPHFIGIHSLNGGIRKISLPQRAIVYDAFKDEIISKNSKEIEIELLPESSSLFFYGDENFINACRMDIWGKK